MITLTSFYYKEYLPESYQKEWIKRGKEKALAQTIMVLKQNTRNGHVYKDTAAMFFIHHVIFNQNKHSAHWTNYLYQLQYSRGQQSNLIIATHSILSLIILPLFEKHPFQKFDFHWIKFGEMDNFTRVNGILGMSQQMLYFQYLITTAVKVCITGEVKL